MAAHKDAEFEVAWPEAESIIPEDKPATSSPLPVSASITAAKSDAPAALSKSPPPQLPQPAATTETAASSTTVQYSQVKVSAVAKPKAPTATTEKYHQVTVAASTKAGQTVAVATIPVKKHSRKECSHMDDNGTYCTNKAVQGGVCKRHGAKRYKYTCAHEGCTNHARTGGVSVPRHFI